MVVKQNWLTYVDVLSFSGEFKLKTREHLESEGYICHRFSYVQLIERLKLDKNYDFELGKNLVWNCVQMMLKLLPSYTFLLKMETG